MKEAPLVRELRSNLHKLGDLSEAQINRLVIYAEDLAHLQAQALQGKKVGREVKQVTAQIRVEAALKELEVGQAVVDFLAQAINVTFAAIRGALLGPVSP